jgi:hypothetical protein
MGAILTDNLPATIIKSACLGDALITSIPKRAKSLCEAKVDIISIAQQASPNPRGQTEELLAQPTAFSRVVSIMPSGIYFSIPT